MADFFRDVVAFFHDMDLNTHIVLVITLFLISLSFFRIVVKQHYNAKKFSIKIVSIIMMIIFLFLAIFIACCF